MTYFNINTVLSGQNPDNTGRTTTIGLAQQCATMTRTVYGTTTSGQSQFMIVQHIGYFHPATSGTYTFSFSNVDDGVHLCLGNNAKTGFTNANVNKNVDYYVTNSAGTYTFTATAGQYYPIRLLFVNAQQCGSFTFSLTDPAGASFARRTSTRSHAPGNPGEISVSPVPIMKDGHATQRAASYHPAFVGLSSLHSANDFARIKNHVHAQDQPWYRAWQHLEAGKLAQTSWKPTPQSVLVRGTNATFAPTNNYGYAYRDAHSAYQLTIRWLVGGNTSYADHAAKILDGWSSTLVDINGTEDKYLAAGLYGYQFANAAELLRGYSGWPKQNQTAFGKMLNGVFAVYNHDFLEHHYNKPDFYYANWDLCNIASFMAIGIFNDNRTMYNYAVNYFKNGIPGQPEVVANGALPYFSIANFTEQGSGKTLMQIQESGRDQGHALLCIALVGVCFPP
ncbi:uncharacterized protein CLUP02_17906 [Colletotrichum lupini]|uniref:PA14 domain-containing protein n=1 Tax=Colletotrichum lupini TaxID=145971 RepID=A0A9Q8SG03_9PEZI|nr:uncharacterized protein CLUP02_17906 [Colletotrichum lupini]UQC76393.1 hypothetical protein CLUP02_17906 [Colletotrichum lupini]